MSARPSARLPRSATGVAAALLLTGVTACTGGEEATPEEPDARGSQGGAAPASAPFRVQVTRVAGRLGKPQRAALARQVRGSLQEYVDDAFLGGEYPRTTFGDSFGAFTAGAVPEARADAGLLTNVRWGKSTQSVRATRRTAYLNVVAPKRKPAGVTAHVDLVFVVDRGERPATRVRLRGRLLLTRDAANRWAIFGYRLNRSDTPVREAS